MYVQRINDTLEVAKNTLEQDVVLIKEKLYLKEQELEDLEVYSMLN